MSIRGTLSTLAATIDLDQYKLIKGLLAFNLGECTDDLFPSKPPSAPFEVSYLKLLLIYKSLISYETCDEYPQVHESLLNNSGRFKLVKGAVI